MNAAEKKSRLPAWGVKLLIWCGPSLVLLLAAVLLFGLVLTKENRITFCLILLVGLIVSLLISLFRSRRSSIAKAWAIILLVLVLLVLGFFSMILPTVLHRSTRIYAQERFESLCSEVFPDKLSLPLELGSPKSLVCHSYAWSGGIFQSRSRTLLCRYEEADYWEEKAALERRYVFRTEPLSTGKTEPSWAEPSAVIGDDVFRVVLPSDDADESSYPYGCYYKCCFIVVTNDVEHEIGYIVFEDRDLDVAQDLPWLLNNYCGWDHIR